MSFSMHLHKVSVLPRNIHLFKIMAYFSKEFSVQLSRTVWRQHGKAVDLIEGMYASTLHIDADPAQMKARACTVTARTCANRLPRP